MAGSSITTKLGSLKKPRRGNSKKWDTSIQGPIKSKKSVGKPNSKKSGGGASAASINSPLTEKASSREYYSAPNYIIDSNTFYVFEFYNLKKIIFIDSKGFEIEFIYQDIPVNRTRTIYSG